MPSLDLATCPEIIDFDTKERCGLPAEIIGRRVLKAYTAGVEPVEHMQIQCIANHLLDGPASMLTA